MMDLFSRALNNRWALPAAIALAITWLLVLMLPAPAEDKPATIDMTAVLTEANGKPIKDCPTGYDFKADPTQEHCPNLTLGAAANYGVSFAVESDRNMDWKTKAQLRALVDKYRDSKTAELTHKNADDLMDRIGNIYKLMGLGDKVIVAEMKILQPVEFGKLADK